VSARKPIRKTGPPLSRCDVAKGMNVGEKDRNADARHETSVIALAMRGVRGGRSGRSEMV
jgi:hypothetical protein